MSHGTESFLRNTTGAGYSVSTRGASLPTSLLLRVHRGLLHWPEVTAGARVCPFPGLKVPVRPLCYFCSKTQEKRVQEPGHGRESRGDPAWYPHQPTHPWDTYKPRMQMLEGGEWGTSGFPGTQVCSPRGVLTSATTHRSILQCRRRQRVTKGIPHCPYFPIVTTLSMPQLLNNSYPRSSEILMNASPLLLSHGHYLRSAPQPPYQPPHPCPRPSVPPPSPMPCLHGQPSGHPSPSKVLHGSATASRPSQSQPHLMTLHLELSMSATHNTCHLPFRSPHPLCSSFSPAELG